MPCAGGYWYGFWETNPKLWEKCKNIVTQQMIEEGWKTYANKFDMVMKKRATKLWYAST